MIGENKQFKGNRLANILREKRKEVKHDEWPPALAAQWNRFQS